MVKNINRKAFYKSPIGWIMVESNGKEITGIDFVSKPRASFYGDPMLKKAAGELRDYFSGKCGGFTCKLRFNGSLFQKKVWAELLKMRPGCTVSYQEVATRIGRSRAVRAVGSAIGRNKMVVVVPCHRVIASSGALSGYASGVWRKKWLLNHETKLRKIK